MNEKQTEDGGKQEVSSQQDKRSVFHTLLESPVLPQVEKALPRLESEGTLLVLAGKLYFQSLCITLSKCLRVRIACKVTHNNFLSSNHKS